MVLQQIVFSIRNFIAQCAIMIFRPERNTSVLPMHNFVMYGMYAKSAKFSRKNAVLIAAKNFNDPKAEQKKEE